MFQNICGISSNDVRRINAPKHFFPSPFFFHPISRGCAYRASCCKAKDPEKPKEIVVCWEQAAYREASLERIGSEEGKLLRVNRSIQAEGAFGELKHNRGFTRFLTCGKHNVLTELYLHAMAQNILKYIAKCNRKQPKAHLLKPKSILKF